MRERLDQLQVFRFIGFSFVFIRHASAWVHFPNPGGNVVNVISFFFILSGFMAAYTVYGQEPDPSFTNIFRYVGKKVKKIYPLYIITTLITVFLADPVIALMHGEAVPVRPLAIQLIRNIFLIQSWFPEGYFMYNGAAWYLSSLVFQYIITLPVLSVLKKMRSGGNKYPDEGRSRIPLFCVMIAILFFAAVLYSYAISAALTGSRLPFTEEYWLYVFPPARFFEYAAGMAAAYIFCLSRKQADHVSRKSRVLFSILEAGIFCLWIARMAFPVPGWTFRIVHWFLPNVLLILIFAYGKGILSSFFRNRLFVGLGDITFELYLIHVITISAVELMDVFLSARGIFLSDSLLFGGSFLITLAAAYLLKKIESHKYLLHRDRRAV